MIDRRVALVVALVAGLMVGCGPAPTDSATITLSSTPEAPVATDTPSASPASSDEPLAAAYEAVFLRLEVVKGSPEVLAIGVDAAGHERQIARLHHAWVAYKLTSGDGYLAPMGAVSQSGLLAIPVSDDAKAGSTPRMHWEIFDLRRPDAAPIAIAGLEQGLEEVGSMPWLTTDSWPSVDWAAGERLGIPWHSCDAISCGTWAFFDGRTGAPIPRRPHAEPMCRTRDRNGSAITLFDGGVIRRDPDGQRKELVPPSGVTFACLAPDDRTIVFGNGQPPSDPVAGMIAPEGGPARTIEGAFAGWLGVDS